MNKTKPKDVVYPTYTLVKKPNGWIVAKVIINNGGCKLEPMMSPHDRSFAIEKCQKLVLSSWFD